MCFEETYHLEISMEYYVCFSFHRKVIFPSVFNKITEPLVTFKKLYNCKQCDFQIKKLRLVFVFFIFYTA